jgi:hypothetical protein
MSFEFDIAVKAPSFDGNLNAAQLASNLVPVARLGSGTASAGTFLRGDQSWQTVTAPVDSYKVTFGNATDTTYTITHNLGSTDVVVQYTLLDGAFSGSYPNPQLEPPTLGITTVTGVDTIAVAFASAPGVDKIRVIIIKA